MDPIAKMSRVFTCDCVDRSGAWRAVKLDESNTTPMSKAAKILGHTSFVKFNCKARVIVQVGVLVHPKCLRSLSLSLCLSHALVAAVAHVRSLTLTARAVPHQAGPRDGEAWRRRKSRSSVQLHTYRAVCMRE